MVKIGQNVQQLARYFHTPDYMYMHVDVLYVCIYVYTCMYIFIYIMYLQRTQHGVKPRLELPNPTGPGVTSVQVPIPANKCGLIIGRGTERLYFNVVYLKMLL